MRTATFLVVAALAAAALNAPVLAQDKAADALAKMRAAIGAGKLDSLQTFSLEAKTARNMGERQLTTDVELYLALPDRYLRVDNITAPIARTMTMGFNGDKVIRPAGMVAGGPVMIMNGVPMAGAPPPPPPPGGGGGQRIAITAVGPGGMRGGSDTGEPPTPEQLAMMDASIIRAQRVELSRMMLGWFGTAHPGLKATYAYAGEAESPDGKAHVISVTADGGFDTKLFIDQSTNLPLMVSYQVPEPIRINQSASPEERQKLLEEARKNRKMIEQRVYFADWKDVDGIQFPHTLQRATGSETTEEWTVTKVKVNPKFDDKKFQ